METVVSSPTLIKLKLRYWFFKFLFYFYPPTFFITVEENNGIYYTWCAYPYKAYFSKDKEQAINEVLDYILSFTTINIVRNNIKRLYKI